MNGIIQYVVFVITGFWFFVITIVPLITFGGGVRIWALPVVGFCPFLLAGYASGLSFIFPRTAAIIAAIIASIFFVLSGVPWFFKQEPAFTSPPVYFIIPAIIILLVSGFAVREAEEPLWKRCQVNGKIILGFFAVVPAFLATAILVRILWRLFGWRLFGFGGG
jgi:hypothetical protein